MTSAKKASAIFRVYLVASIFLIPTLIPSLAQAGFNGDTFVDAVFSNSGAMDNENRVCLGDGTGAADSFTCMDLSSNTDSSADVAIGDLDNDGILDVVIANFGDADRVCLGDGTGSFSCSDISGSSDDNVAVALGDVNNDGDLDAVFATGAAANQVCLGDGAGGFSACNTVSMDTNQTTGVALGDVNLDGNLDAVFANPLDDENNRVCLGDGTGATNSFTCSNVSTPVTDESEVAALGDVNNDGALDAFIVNGFSQVNKVCLGDGLGGFSCARSSADTNSSRSVALGDVNGDGDLDAVIINGTEKNRVCLGDGTGTMDSFTCSDVSGAMVFSRGVALGDVNNDTLLDAVIAKSPAVNKACLGDGLGGFTCNDVSADTNASSAVALTPSIINSPSPDALDFAALAVGNTSPDKIFQITNLGTAPLIITNVYLAGTDLGEFNILAETCTSAGPIPGSSTCLVQVEFSPTSVGAKAASVHFIDNVGTPVVDLSGTGIMPILMIVPGAPFDFGTVVVGGQSASETFTLSNTGDADLKLGTISLSGTDPADFLITADACSHTTLGMGDDCTLDVAFAPGSSGVKSADLNIPSDDPSSPTLHGITGIGIIPGMALTNYAPTVLDYDQVQVGDTPLMQDVTLTNVGGDDLVIDIMELAGEDPAAFSQTNTCDGMTLSAGDSCIIAISFTPTFEGIFNAILRAVSNADNPDDFVTLLARAGAAGDGGCSLSSHGSASTLPSLIPWSLLLVGFSFIRIRKAFEKG